MQRNRTVIGSNPVQAWSVYRGRAGIFGENQILERSEMELSTLVFQLVRSGERRTQTLQITKIGRSQPQGLPPANNTSGKNTWIFWTLILSKLC